MDKADKKTQKQEDKKIHIAGLKGGQRVKVVEAQEPEVVEKAEAKKKKERQIEAKVRGKKYIEAKSKISRDKLYSIPEAISLVKNTSYSSFDGTMEVHIVVKKTGLSANVTLPFSAGKAKKVEVASNATIEKLKSGKIDFDVLLATAEFMPKLVVFAKTLGPKGLMPNPRNGTLIKSTKDADKFSANSVTLKTEKSAPLMHTAFGKVSQSDKELASNLEAILAGVGKTQLVKAFVKSTMSPSVKLAI